MKKMILVTTMMLSSLLCAATTQPTTQPVVPKTYYVIGATGNDNNDGSKAHPWKSIHVVDDAVVKVVGTFHQTVSMGDHVNATVDGQGQTTIDSDYCTQWNGSKNCTLANVTLTSDDGKGLGGNVYGVNVTLTNVNFGNLNEGMDYLGPVNGLTITGGGQTGKVAGRCHFFLNTTNVTWTGDPTKHFGPASSQSPIRLSSPAGITNGTVTGVHVTQVGSPFPIACVAAHHMVNVKWINCTVEGGEFSFNTAGDATQDLVKDCVITNLTAINTKVSLDQGVAFNNQFIGGTFTNINGECVSVSCTNPNGGNSFTGVTLNSPKHGFHFYTVNNTKISRCILNGLKNTPIMDGSFTPSNDGGGNILKVK